MKNAFFAIILTLIGVVVIGCCSKPAGFQRDVRPGRTRFESKAEICRTVDIQRAQFWDDWDRFWLLDRPSRLNTLKTR